MGKGGGRREEGRGGTQRGEEERGVCVSTVVIWKARRVRVRVRWEEGGNDVLYHLSRIGVHASKTGPTLEEGGKFDVQKKSPLEQCTFGMTGCTVGGGHPTI